MNGPATVLINAAAGLGCIWGHCNVRGGFRTSTRARVTMSVYRRGGLNFQPVVGIPISGRHYILYPCVKFDAPSVLREGELNFVPLNVSPVEEC